MIYEADEMFEQLAKELSYDKLGVSVISEEEWNESEEETTQPFFKIDDTGDEESNRALLDEQDSDDGGIMQEQYGLEFEV